MEKNIPLIILVDDNPTLLRAGKNVLSKKYTVATAPSAEKLFSLLVHNRPSMILLDTDMPGMDGYETLKRLKAGAETADIPVFLLGGPGGGTAGPERRGFGQRCAVPPSMAGKITETLFVRL